MNTIVSSQCRKSLYCKTAYKDELNCLPQMFHCHHLDIYEPFLAQQCSRLIVEFLHSHFIEMFIWTFSVHNYPGIYDMAISRSQERLM